VTPSEPSTARRLRAAGLAALILAFLVAAGYGVVDATKQLSLITKYFRISSWIAAQVQAEYLRFYGAVTAYWADPSAAARADMMQRLDVFWSRLPIALEGDESRQVREIPGAAAIFQTILDDLPSIEAELDRLAPGDDKRYRDLLERLERYREPLSNIAQAITIGLKAGISESEMRRGSVEMVLSFLAVVVAGGIFIALVLHAKRQNTRLYVEAREAAQQLDQVKKQLVDALEGISESFALFDRDERLVLANTRFRHFYATIADLARPGATLEEIARAAAERRQFKTELMPDVWVARRLAQCRSPGSPVEHVLADGRILRVSDRRTQQGGYVSVGTDVTDKKLAEKLLEDRLAAIEASLDGLAILDRDGRFVYLNRSHATLHDYDEAAQLIGQSWRLLYDKDEQQRFEQTILPRLRDAGSWRGEAVGRRRDGTSFPQELSFTRLPDGSLVCGVRDTSERKRAEEERSRLAEQFHFAQRSEALGRLAGGIAHDFNNILAIISGFTELSLLDLGDDHPVQENLGKVLAAGRRAKGLVQQILAYSRQSGSDRRPLRIDLLLKETSSLLRATLPATIGLSKRIDTSETLVKADASQIDQIVMNLCVNAMHAIGDRGGSIELGLEDCCIDGGGTGDGSGTLRGAATMAPRIGQGRGARGHSMWIGQLSKGDYVRLSVQDDGCGMDAATLKRIFDPFFTTKPTGTGTGLGLAAVLGIVSDHGGAICVDTELGAGTSFEVYLPACAAATDVAAPPVRRTPKANVRATILVVDDEAELASLICTVLRGLGYSAVSCTSGAAALSIIRDDPFAVDLLLTDQTMPGMTGDELAIGAKTVRPDLPIILCTGFSARLNETLAKEIGASALLYKPMSRDDLGQAVARALQRPAEPKREIA
jgi:PAS domain S-box-containing protein